MRAQPRDAVVFAMAGLLVLATATMAVFAVPGVRSSRGFVPLVDGWVQGTGYVAAAVLSLLGARRGSPDGSLSVWFATGLTCRAMGFVAFLSVVRREQPQPYPSVADAFWLATYAFVVVGARCRNHRLRGQRHHLPRRGHRR